MKKQYRDFESAREFVRKLGLKNSRDWEKYCQSKNKPNDIPSAPLKIYKNKGWKGMGNWLGTGVVANQIKYRSFIEARQFVRKLKLKGTKEWKEYCKSGNKPDDIPAAPWKTYKEWKKK